MIRPLPSCNSYSKNGPPVVRTIGGPFASGGSMTADVLHSDAAQYESILYFMMIRGVMEISAVGGRSPCVRYFAMLATLR